MGGLATEPDLLTDPILETTAVESRPLWRGRTVDVPDWPEPAEVNDTPTMTRHFWRGLIAQWPLELRQRWGDRANQLQDSGLDWKRAERLAFEELMERRPIAGSHR